MVRVKICGITNVEDALWAAENGADAVGFVFAESPRRIDAARAGAIAKELPPFVSVVGIFVEPDPRTAKEILDKVGLDYIQYYGTDEDRFLQESGLSNRRLIHTVRVGSEADLVSIEKTPAGLILLDTKVEGKAGGTGESFDWAIAAKAKAYGKPIVLSGGLNAETVARAIEIASPDAVDVSSGVEAGPGRKDPEKVREFIRRAKGHVT